MFNEETNVGGADFYSKHEMRIAFRGNLSPNKELN